MSRILLALIIPLLAFAAPASAQVQTGTPVFGSFSGGPDVINLANLNSHITIPVLNKSGRGMNFNYNLIYDSSIWYPVSSNGIQTWQFTTATNWGWTTSIPRGGHVSNTMTYSQHRCAAGGLVDVYVYSRWAYVDGFGTPHPFVGTSVRYGNCPNMPPTSFTATASDDSGYAISVTGANVNSLTASDGAVINPVTGAITLKDRNGNQITSSTASGTTSYYDTLSSTTPVLAVSGSGTPSSSTVFTFTPPSTSSSNCASTNTAGMTCYTMNYTNYTVATNFGLSTVNEFGATAVPLVSSIVLPDGSEYSFFYEVTPSIPTSGACTPLTGTYPTYCVTGRLKSFTLPTGGTINYTYIGGNNGILPDGSVATLERITPDGTWTYGQVKNTGAASTTTITDPSSGANQTVIQFQGIYETVRQVFQGSSTSGTLLRTWITCYNGNLANCPTTAVSSPITERDVFDIYGATTSTAQCRHVYIYNAVGGLTEQDDYDYGPTAPGPLLRQTLITFASLSNITAFRQQVTVKNGAGTTVSQTNYNYDETSPGTTSGIAQHTSVTGSRGNLTSINYPASALTSHFKYYDTGSPNTSQDVNGATTTYNYGTDNAANCQMAFPTSISEPLSMSRSMTWNCTGGVMTQLKDENGQTTGLSTNYTWNDPYFWRPNDVTDQLANQTAITYQPNSTNCCPWAVASSLTFNNGNSVAIHVQYKDGLGRTYVDQQLQGPGSSTLDSVSYTFDANGRPYSVSVPCAVSWTATCSTPKTTQTYDALNRPLVTTDGGAGTVTYSYSNNDVLVTVGPAPSGENTKRRQLEYDALGRLTSVCELTTLAGSGTCGQTTTQTGYWTKYIYDALGDLSIVTQNAQATSANQQTRTYMYDAMGRLTAESNPESGTTAYSYDVIPSGCANAGVSSSGDLTKRVDAAGHYICPMYDALHRVTDVGSDSGCKRFRYDGTNGVLGSKPPGVAVTNTFGRAAEAETDTCSWPITQSSIITDEWFSYTARGETSDVYESTPHSGAYYHSASTYWANGALNQLNAYIGSTLNYSANWNVDGEGRPYSNYPVTSTAYNAASQPTQVNFTWGDSDSYTYDPNTGRMTQYQFTVNGQSNTGALTWNANGTLRQLAITDPFNSADTQTCNYGSASPPVAGYDDLARLVSANCGSAAAQTFSYDPFGNLNKSGSPYSFQPTYSTSTNRMTSLGTFTPSYDNNGNLLSDNVHSYAWDAYGNSVSLDGVAITFDAFGRMVEQNRSGAYTQFAYSPTGFKMQILNGQAVTRNFVPLPGGGTAVYNTTAFQDVRHRDWLGSSRFASTASRTMYYDGAYAPFGEPYAQSGSAELSFTGMNSDTTSGVYDFPYREYSMQGRWASPDPAGLAAVNPANPQSWNRYAYVLNNPLKFVDPRGLYCEFFDDNADNVESIDAYSSPDECGSNGGSWVDDNTTVLVNANDPNNPDSLGGPGSGLPPVGCSFFYQNGNLDGTLCGNQFSPAELPPTSQAYLVAIHNQLSKLPTVCGKVGIFASLEIGGFGGFAQVDENGNASATSLIPAAPGVTDNVQSSGNGPLVFYGEGAGVLYEPDLGNYGAPAAVGGYLGYTIPGTKTEGAIGVYVENPSIAGAYSCPPQ